MLQSGGDPETIDRWLAERRPDTLHYPYSEIDGTRIDFDGDGVVTRCTNFVAGDPDSRVEVLCAWLPGAAQVPRKTGSRRSRKAATAS